MLPSPLINPQRHILRDGPLTCPWPRSGELRRADVISASTERRRYGSVRRVLHGGRATGLRANRRERSRRGVDLGQRRLSTLGESRPEVDHGGRATASKAGCLWKFDEPDFGARKRARGWDLDDILAATGAAELIFKVPAR